MNWSKEPKIDRKTGEHVGWRYRFQFYDVEKRKNIRVPNNWLENWGREILSDRDADLFCKMKDAELDAAKHRIEQRLLYEGKFYNFEALLEDYAKLQQENAPNSWENDLYYLRYYVFAYFLGERSAANVNKWGADFDGFRDWLRATKLIKGDKPMAVSTMNHCIKTLNNFLGMLRRKGLCSDGAKCPVFPKHLVKARTIEDVYSLDEIEQVHAALKSDNLLSADFFSVLANTGLRTNEAFGLSLLSVHPDYESDSPTYKELIEILEAKKHVVYGWIYLQDQPALDQLRAHEGNVPRKPLKGRKQISDRYSRLIPITSKETWRTLANLWNRKVEECETGKWGQNEADYLLFDGINKSIFANDLRAAFATIQKRYKSPHCLRHTFATFVHGFARGNRNIVELILGHKDIEVMDRYNHLIEEMNRTARTQAQRKRGRITVD